MNHQKIVFSLACIFSSLTAQSQTRVFFAQIESKKDAGQVVIVSEEEKPVVVSTPALAVREFSEGLAAIRTLDKSFGFINLQGELVIPARFQDVGFFSNELAWAKAEDGKAGYIDQTGRWVIRPEYDAARPFDIQSDMARVKQDGSWFYVNSSGVAMKVDSEGYWDFSEGLAQGRKGDLMGFFDNTGNWVIEPKFQDAKKFKNGQAAVKLNDRWGIIDKTGNWLVEAKYEVLKEAEVIE